MDNISLLILGSFVSLLMGVNAFFLKDILKTLKNLELKFIELDTEHSMYSKLVNKHDDELDKYRERLHELEGAYKTFASFIQRHE